MIREKIGKGYLQSGYGRGFNKGSTIWLINGKAYAREIRRWRTSEFPLTGELEGYIRVNKLFGGSISETFVETNSDENHHKILK